MAILSSYSKAKIVYLVVILGVSVPLIVDGQCITQTIDVNEAGGFKKNLPFDESFRVKLGGKSSRHVYAAYAYYYQSGALNKIPTGNPNDRITQYYAGNSLLLEVPTLEPKKEVAIGVVYRPHGDRLKTLLGINSLILDGNLDEAQRKYDSLDLSSVNTIGKNTVTYLIYNWSSYSAYFTATLAPLYTSLDVSTIVAGEFTSFTKANFNAIFTSFTSNSISTTQLSTLAVINETSNLQPLETGSIGFTDFTTVSGLDDIKSRTTNLKATQKQLNSLLAQLDRLLYNVPRDSTATTLRADVQGLRNRVQVSDQNHLNGMMIIKENISNNTNLYFGGFYYGTNNFSDLKTEGSYRVIPTVGVAFVPAFGRGDFELLTLTYVGATIYFRPVNKNLCRNCHDWRFKQRFSVNIGVTLSSIESNEFQNFFNGTSLLAGGHYKLTRTISLTAGGILMKQTDENPIIDDTHTVIRPYAGISLDLDIASLFGSVKTKLF